MFSRYHERITELARETVWISVVDWVPEGIFGWIDHGMSDVMSSIVLHANNGIEVFAIV